MHVISIMPYRYWRNVKTGHKAGIHGAVPYTSEADKANWEVVTSGFTQVWSDNTTRNRAETSLQCANSAHCINARRIDQLKDHAEFYPETAQQCREKIRQIPLTF